MAVVSELIVSIGAEGTQAVLSALKQVDGAQVQLSNSTKNLGGTTQTQTQNMGMNWSELVTGINQGLGIARTVIGGVKSAVEFSEQGANLQTLAQRFDRLAQSVGTNSTSLLSDMQKATKGVKSDSELMGLAVDMIGLGFAGTSEEAVRLASVAGALDMNMNQLALTLANQTTMRFDQLGVGIDGFDEKLQKLKDTGMEVDDAFQEAFLQQAELQIEKVGHVADMASGKWEKMNAAQSNFMDNMKRFASDNMGWWADFWGGAFTTAGTEMANAVNVQDLSANNMIPQAVLDNMRELALIQEGMTGVPVDPMIFLNEAINNNQDVWNHAVDNYKNGYKTIEEAGGNAYSYMITQEKQATVDTAALIAQQQQLLKVQNELINVTGLTSNFGSIVQFAQEYTQIQTEINAKQAEYDKMPGWKQASKEGQQLLKDIENLNKGYTDLANQMTLDMFQATIAIGGVTDAEMGAYLDMAVEMGFISQEGADAAVDAYNDAIEQINKLGIDEKTGNVVVDAAAAFATFDLIEAYAFSDKIVRVMMKTPSSAGPWNQEAIGGPVYPDKLYNWNEPGREGELLVPSQYGRVLSSTEVATAIREALKPGDGGSAGQQPQVVNNNHTEVIVNATVASDFDLDKLTREIVRRVNL